MKRNFISYFIFVFIIISLGALLSSCGEESGLGSAIDTKAPVLSIDYPKASGSAIRDSFILAGSVSDDKSISYITVSVKSLDDGGKISEKYFADYDISKNRWWIDVNKYDSGNQFYHNGWQYPDGKYEFSVTAFDNAGNNSGTYSKTFEIDNTPPLFIISNPGVIKKTGLSPSAYGSIFTIDGTISDNHTITYMDVKIFDADGVCVSSESYEGSNIPFYREEDIATAGGTSVQIAQYGNQASNSRYSQLHPQETGTEYYYAEIKLTDSTKVYKNPWDDGSRNAATKEADELGNSTSSLYLYDDVYSSLISSKKGLGLSASNLKDIISGVYDGDLDRDEILAMLEEKRYDTSDSNGTEPMANKLAFSLNPEANPTYIVNGFEFGFNPDDPLQSASTGNTVSVTISAGLDGTNIAPENVRVWMKTLSSRPSAPEPIKADLNLLEKEVEALEREEAEFMDAIHQTEENPATKISVNGDSWKLIYDYSLNNSKGNSVVTKTFSVTLPEGIEMSKYYILGISGYDIDDVEFSQKVVYGFEGNTAGIPPIISFESPRNLSVWPDFEKPEFQGTAVISSSALYLTELSAEVRITDESSNALIGEYSDKIRCMIENEAKIWTESETKALTWNSSEDKWHLDAAKFTGLIEKFNQAEQTGLHWLATVKITGKSSSAHEGEAVQSIHIDTVKPKVVISSINPSVIGQDYFGAGDSNIYLNGKITIVGNVEDLNLSDDEDAVSYDILASIGDSQPRSILSELIAKKKELGLDDTSQDGNFDGKLGKVFSINIPIDTNIITKFFGDSDQKIQTEFVVTAKDKAGNVGTYSSKLLNSTSENPEGKNFVIHQETNRPKITLGNADCDITEESGIEEGKNLFGITNNNRLQIAVSDDDSIVDYEIFIWKAGSQQPEKPAKTEMPAKTSDSINYVLPTEPGTYNVKIVARDFIRSETNGDENNATGINVTGPFAIGVDSGAPVLRVTAPSNNSWISANTDIALAGTVSKLVGLTVSGYVYSVIEGQRVKACEVTDIAIDENENADKTYSFTGKFKLPEGAYGKYLLHIEAKDIYKQESHVDLDIGVDKSAPAWVEDYEKSPFMVNKKPYSHTEGEGGHSWYNAESLLFSGAWEEPQSESGIESVYWKVVKAGEEDVAPSKVSDFQNSFVTRRDEESDFETFAQNLGEFIVNNDEDGNARPNIVYMMASDIAGNHSEVKKFYIYIDSESPSFESDRTGTQYSNKKLPIEVTGSATDDAAGLASVKLTIYEDNTSKPLEISKDVSEISATITSANDASDVNRKKWTATIPQVFLATLQEKPYAVKATIMDKAGNKSASTIFRIDVDAVDPEVKNISLSDESEVYSVFRTTENEAPVFYAHNGDNFSLTGSVQDAKAGIESIKIYADLNPNDANPVPIKTVTALPVYNLDLSSSKYPGDSVKLTLVATDHAGNEKRHELSVKFDNIAPKGIHAIDANRKDIFFRIGELANDDISSSDSLWNDELDKDVGGKYSDGTYGNASTVKIRGAFRENGSGLAMIYYRLISGERGNAAIRSEADSFIANYKELADGYFAPLAKEKYEEKRVFYTPKADGKLTNEDDDEIEFNESNTDYENFAKDFASLGAGKKSYATVTANYDNVISGFAVGKNYLFLVAVDNVGNALLDGIKLKDNSADAQNGYLMHPDISINVDNQVPLASRTKAEGEADIFYTNKEAGSKITITGIASDADAGLRSIVIKNGEKEISEKDGEYGKIEITSPANAKSGDKNWSWKAEIKADKFFADSPDGSTSISAIVTDDAGVGNSQTVNLATLIIDTDDPIVSLDTPKDAEPSTSDIIEINGEMTLSGSVKDGNTLPENDSDEKSNTIKHIRYAKFDSKPSAPPANDSTSWQELSGLTIKGSYTFTASGFDTTSYEDEKFYYIQAVGEDKSGNTGYSPALLVKISQDTDRPKVKINNLNPNGSSYILKYGSNAQVTGTITDDDSTNSSTIKKLFITESEYTGSGSEPINLANSTGDFTFQPSDTEDGVKSFYIYIEDNEGGKFYTTATTGRPNVGNPKIYVKGSAASESVNKEKFTYSSDGTNPVVKLGEGLPYATETSAVAKDDSGNPFALTTSTTATSNATLNASFNAGGNSRRFVKLYFTAWDASGIAGMTVELKKEDETSIIKLTTAAKIGDLEMTDCTLSGTFTPSSSGASDASWSTDFIDLENAGTGQLSVSVTPYDNAALSGNGAFQINVDNTAPTIEIRSPTSGDEVSGSVSIAGTASDKGIAGSKDIQWLVPTVDEINTYNSKTTDKDKLDYLKSLSWKGGSSALAHASSVTAWQFDFDGNKNDKFDSYDSETYAGENITSDGVYTLPVFFLATDDLDNCSAKTDFVIRHNPDADKPKLEFSYPNKENYVSETERYAVLGGTIRATGSAEIPSRTTTVNSIYFQLADENALFTGKADASEAGTDSYKAKNDYHYTVVSAYDVLREVTGNQSITSSTEISEDHLKAYGFKSNDDLKNWWGIKASGTGAWNIKLNENGELNPTSGTTNITIRACGVNAEGKFGAWTSGDNLIAIHIDNTAPVISAEIDKYGDGSSAISACPSVAPASSKVYEADMYLKGCWTLVASLLDETSVEGYSVLKNGTPLSKGSNFFVEEGISNSDNSKKGVRLYIPIPKDSANVKIKINAQDKEHIASQEFSFNIDEIAPTLDSLSGNGTLFKKADGTSDFSSIENSDYRFTIAGSSMDEGSGLENVVFYYMRKNGVTRTSGTFSKEVVMDPMITSGTDDSKVEMENLEKLEFTQGSEKFYLYAKEYTGSATAETFTAASLAADSYVRVGGLIQIDGVLRRITKINSSTVTFTPSLAAAKDSISAYFPIAQVIDNSATEKLRSYAGTSFDFEKGDDGDGMPESFSKIGKTWTWDATIHSDNMPDGPVSLVILAFDKAGNVAGQTVNTNITNNAPRLAKLFLSTDLNDNNDFETNEFEEYSVIGKTGLAQSSYTIDFANFGNEFGAGPFTAKNKLAVVPEIVGGNKTIRLVAKKDASNENAVSGSGSDLLASIAGKKATSTSATSLTNGNESQKYKISADKFCASAKNNNFYAYVLENSQLTGITNFDENKETDDGRTENEKGDGSDKNFSFTFWDETEETSPGSDSQKAVVLVKGFTFDLTDGTKPTVVVNPFYWQNLNSNSIYDSSAAEKVGDLKGHIELENDIKGISAITSSLGDDPKVSGKITFTGTAYDEHSLASLKFSFGNGSVTPFDNEVIATYKNENSVWELYDGTSSKSIDSDGYEAKIEVVKTENGRTIDTYGVFEDKVYFGQKGHKIFWTLSINTEKLSSVAAKDMKLTVIATDLAKNETVLSEGSGESAVSKIVEPVVTADYIPASQSGSRTVEDGITNYPQYQVDVVPYVTVVETALRAKLKSSIKDAYSRTSHGHYIARSDENITVKGFNLGTLVKKPLLNTDELTVNADGTVTLPAEKLSTSGKVSFTVNGIPTLNNLNDNNACGAHKASGSSITESSLYAEKATYAYNRLPNRTSNNLLTDDVEIDVWYFDSDAAKPLSGELREPVMKINPVNGKIGLAFVDGPGDFAMGWYNTNSEDDNSSYLRWQSNFATYNNIAFTFDSLGYSHGTASGLDTNPSSLHAGRFSYFYGKWKTSETSTTEANYNGSNAIRLESIGIPNTSFSYTKDGTTKNVQLLVKGEVPTTDSLTETRFFSPSIVTAVHDNSTAVYLAYYDSIQSQIRFRYSKALPDSKKDADNFVDNNGIRKSDKANDKKTYQEAKTEHFSLIAGADYQQGDFTTKDSKDCLTGYDTGFKAGKYVAIDAIAGSEAAKDIVVAVWYDGMNCRYAYNTNPTSGKDNGNAGGWTGNKIIFSEGGEHCTVKIDPKGGIHIAAYVDGGLRYAYLSRYDSDYSEASDSVLVDSFTVTGERINIDAGLVDSGKKNSSNEAIFVAVPYISYFNGTARLPCVAKLLVPENGIMNYKAKGTGTDDGNDIFTGNWEISLVPSSKMLTVMYYDKINIGLWKQDGKIVNSNAEGFIQKTSESNNTITEKGNIYGNGTANPILGYVIESTMGTCLETAQMK